MRRHYARQCPELAESSIFTNPIASSLAVPTLPPSVIESDLAQAIIGLSHEDVIDFLSEMPLDRDGEPEGEASARFRHGDLYVAMSALQKAIRLGKPDLANAACSWMVGNGHGAACWRRLRTIAVEDIGVADPQLMLVVLWLAERRSLHASFGDARFARLVISPMCAAVKSRDMADIATWATLPGSIDHLMPGFGRARASELVAIVSDERQSFQTRHAAARALFPARFGAVQPWKRRAPTDRTALCEALGLPPALAIAIERDVAFGGDVLTSAGPIAWVLLKSSQTISTGPDSFEPAGTELIKGVLASSFDRHTRLGRAVLAKMLRDHQPWVDFFDRHKLAGPMECVMRALFYLEGGILRPRLSYDRSSELYWSILQAKFATTGIASLDEDGWELLELVREAMPEINARRQCAVGAVINPGRTFR